MRAWFYVLAVLMATLKLTVPVASTSTISALSTSSLSASSSSSSSSSILSPSSSSSSTLSTSSTSSSSTTTKPTSISQKQQQKHNQDEENQRTLDPVALEHFEKTLFSQLGLKKRPRIKDRSQIVIPDHLKEIYNKLVNGHELKDSVTLPMPGVHTKSANTIRSYAHEGSKIDKRFLNHHKFRLYFNVSNIPKNEELKAAELSLSRTPINNEKNQIYKHKILVYDIIRPGIKGQTEPILLLIDTKTVRTNESGAVKLDVLPAVERWLVNRRENYGLLIEIVNGKLDKPVYHRHIRLKRSLEYDNDEIWNQNQPFLFTYTDDGRSKSRTIEEAINSRNKRAAGGNGQRRQHKRKDGREICQRKPLYVDFSNVGWSDWIVAPPGYDAFYCHGECTFPLADHLNSTNHAVVQTLVHSIDQSMAPKACCVPTQLNPISMLYLDDENKVVLKNYQEMTVVACGCR